MQIISNALLQIIYILPGQNNTCINIYMFHFNHACTLKLSSHHMLVSTNFTSNMPYSSYTYTLRLRNNVSFCVSAIESLILFFLSPFLVINHTSLFIIFLHKVKQFHNIWTVSIRESRIIVIHWYTFFSLWYTNSTSTQIVYVGERAMI